MFALQRCARRYLDLPHEVADAPQAWPLVTPRGAIAFAPSLYDPLRGHDSRLRSGSNGRAGRPCWPGRAWGPLCASVRAAVRQRRAGRAARARVTQQEALPCGKDRCYAASVRARAASSVTPKSPSTRAATESGTLAFRGARVRRRVARWRLGRARKRKRASVAGGRRGSRSGCVQALPARRCARVARAPCRSRSRESRGPAGRSSGRRVGLHPARECAFNCRRGDAELGEQWGV
jgi:hypothetical protein